MRRNKLANFVATSVVALAILLGAAEVARADTAVFNFENQAINNGLTTLTLVQSGLSVTITRPGATPPTTPPAAGASFGITNITTLPNPSGQGFPASFGSRSLSPVSVNLSDDTRVNTPFVANFSLPLSAISIDLGDLGFDVDVLRLEAFSGANATGTLLDVSTFTLSPLSNDAFSFSTLSVTAPGINSIRFIGGSQTFPNSVFYDNLTATFNLTTPTAPIPEPATLLLLGTGLAGTAARLRRRRKAERP